MSFKIMFLQHVFNFLFKFVKFEFFVLNFEILKYFLNLMFFMIYNLVNCVCKLYFSFFRNHHKLWCFVIVKIFYTLNMSDCDFKINKK